METKRLISLILLGWIAFFANLVQAEAPFYAAAWILLIGPLLLAPFIVVAIPVLLFLSSKLVGRKKRYKLYAFIVTLIFSVYSLYRITEIYKITNGLVPMILTVLLPWGAYLLCRLTLLKRKLNKKDLHWHEARKLEE